MLQRPASRRAFAAALIAVGLTVTFPCDAANAPSGNAVAPLPETLTKESVRDLVSRLSDEEVRALLIAQLDRATAPAAARTEKPTSTAEGMPMAGMAGMVGQHAGTIRDRLVELYGALVAFPSTMREVGAQLAIRGDASALWRLAAHLAAMLLIGWIAQRMYDYALKGSRARLLGTPAAAFSARAFQLAVGLLLDIGGIAVFALGALAFFFARWMADELQRIAVLSALLVIVVVRIAALLAGFLLASRDGQARLLPFEDAPARTLRRFAIATTVIFGIGIVAQSLLVPAGTDMATVDLIRIVGWTAGLVIGLVTIWRVRKPIADLIRGDTGHGSIIGWVADLWPLAAMLYFVTLYVAGVSGILAGMPGPVGLGFASVLVLIALPIVDMAMCRALAAAAEHDTDENAPRRLLGAYEPVFRRGIHIVVAVVGLLSIAQLWQLNLFRLAQGSLGGKIASSLLGIGIVLLAAYMIWEIVRMAIDRKLHAEGKQSDDVPASRLRTLLPILRATILVTISVMAAMSILAALGVDILPLLAGASIVGVAIGFGSQTLVRDIVSGAFFLMDDAFRLGEYIEVGDAKGRVEKINVRSVFLRHHRGALNVLPYGEIKRLRNTSRDWQVHVMEFRLPYDTSMVQVKKIVKEIGEELAGDPDYAADILQPLKSAGVMSAEDSAVVVRVKFTARPTNNAWVVRRVAYDKIIRAFRAAGIRFAHREVTVTVPTSHDVASGGAAAIVESQAAHAIDKASQP